MITQSSTLASRISAKQTAIVIMCARIFVNEEPVAFFAESANFLSLSDGKILLKVQGMSDKLLTQDELERISDIVASKLPIPGIEIDSEDPAIGRITCYKSNFVDRPAEEDAFLDAITQGYKLAVLHKKAT